MIQVYQLLEGFYDHAHQNIKIKTIVSLLKEII